MKRIQFKGTGTEYFKIWIVNVLLCIVTIGIYYPWAKVRTRRYFYANTEYADRYFDYHATGKQLFFGYLIGVLILLAMQISRFYFAFYWHHITHYLICFHSLDNLAQLKI